MTTAMGKLELTMSVSMVAMVLVVAVVKMTMEVMVLVVGVVKMTLVVMVFAGLPETLVMELLVVWVLAEHSGWAVR